ncbi:MAG: Swt1 family HEPN domain-containing protein [Sphingobium sp.]
MGTKVKSEFIRNRDAFDRLQRLETALRYFVDEAMSAQFGNDWMDAQVDRAIVDGWRRKRDIEVSATGIGASLIQYADFTDYKAIIERSDNWRRVFRSVFNRLADIQESLQRLYPIRNKAMHARMLTKAERNLLIVEAHRVRRALENGKQVLDRTRPQT